MEPDDRESLNLLVATSIRRAMTAHGVTVVQLAERLQVTPASISQNLSGRRNLSLELVERYADALGLHLRVDLTVER